MYIGVGTLFCVTLPDEIRYGIGVRICAPSMPLPSEPSTRLSRVVPQDACFCTSTSGMPYLAKMPFSLATNSGAASVSAMKPSLAPFTSGPRHGRRERRRKLRTDRGEQRRRPRWPSGTERRLTPLSPLPSFLIVIFACSLLSPGRPARCVRCTAIAIAQTKKPLPGDRERDSRTAALLSESLRETGQRWPRQLLSDIHANSSQL